MRTVENKDGSITTYADDEEAPAREAKVVESSDEKPAAKTRSKAESK